MHPVEQPPGPIEGKVVVVVAVVVVVGVVVVVVVEVVGPTNEFFFSNTQESIPRSAWSAMVSFIVFVPGVAVPWAVNVVVKPFGSKSW